MPFARCLVDLAERALARVPIPLAMGLFFSPRRFEDRVRDLLRKDRKTMTRLNWTTRILVALFALVAGGLLLTCSVQADDDTTSADLLAQAKPQASAEAQDPKEKREQIEKAIEALQKAGLKDEAARLRELLQKDFPAKPEPKDMTEKRKQIEEAIRLLEKAGLKDEAARLKGQLPKASSVRPGQKGLERGAEGLRRGAEGMENGAKALEAAGLADAARLMKEAAAQMRENAKRMSEGGAKIDPKGPLDMKSVDELLKRLRERRKESDPKVPGGK